MVWVQNRKGQQVSEITSIDSYFKKTYSEEECGNKATTKEEVGSREVSFGWCFVFVKVGGGKTAHLCATGNGSSKERRENCSRGVLIK